MFDQFTTRSNTGVTLSLEIPLNLAFELIRDQKELFASFLKHTREFLGDDDIGTIIIIAWRYEPDSLIEVLSHKRFGSYFQDVITQVKSAKKQGQASIEVVVNSSYREYPFDCLYGPENVARVSCNASRYILRDGDLCIATAVQDTSAPCITAPKAEGHCKPCLIRPECQLFNEVSQ